jgi:hypothetical protein
MLKNTLKENLRSPIKYIILILIFTAAFTALCFGVNYYKYVESNVKDIDRSFTTIAFPDTEAIKNVLPPSINTEGGYVSIDYTPEAEFYLSLRQFAKNSRNGIMDDREILRGVGDSITPVLSGTFDPLGYDGNADAPRNSAAFIVTVADIIYSSKLDFESELYKKFTIFSGGGVEESAHYVVKFQINETIVLNSSYQKPEYVYVSSGAFTTDMQCPFEYGKQYFISGIYYGVRVIQKERDNGTPFSETYYEIDSNSVPSIYLDGSNFVSIPNIISEREAPIVKNIEINGVATTAYTYSNKELSQMCIEYEGDLNNLIKEQPDVADRLNNNIINANSIEVKTTTNLNSFVYFNQGKSLIISGRTFLENEIISGLPVCIVSENLATYNNLKVGSSFNVDLYSSIMRRQNDLGTWEMTPFKQASNVNEYNQERSRGSLSLKIIGIYNSLPLDFGAYAFNDNTIFIPSNSVPIKNDSALPVNIEDLNEAERFMFSLYSHHMIPTLFTVIVSNDKLEAFKTEANEAGLGNYFLYNDQGYSQIKDTLPMIAKSAYVLMIILGIGFMGILVLYLAMLPRKRHEIGMLISLGMKHIEAVMHITFGWLITFLPAIILSFAINIIYRSQLTEIVLKTTVSQLNYNNTFSAGTQISALDISNRFGDLANNHTTTTIILVIIFCIYLITALIVNVWISKQPILKLLRRNE